MRLARLAALALLRGGVLDAAHRAGAAAATEAVQLLLLLQVLVEVGAAAVRRVAALVDDQTVGTVVRLVVLPWTGMGDGDRMYFKEFCLVYV